MHLRNILAITRKDILDILLNKGALIVLVSPIVFALLFSVLSGVTSSKTTNMLIYNPGGSAIERIVSTVYPQTTITRAASASEVQAAFGPDGAHKNSSYALGLVVPADFEAGVRTGTHPQVLLYTNGDSLNKQQGVVLAQALVDYGRSVANPRPPADVQLSSINPPTTSDLAFNKSFFVMYVLVSSLMVGSSIVPGMIVEEKERKTLRMLMVSPASFADVILGKLLVGLIYQLGLLLFAILLMQGYFGNVPLLLLYAVLGSSFSVALGLLGGALFNSTSAVGGFSGFVSFIYVLPALFVGPLGQLLQGNLIVQFMKIFPTYYLAEGAFNALIQQGSSTSTLQDLLIVAGATLLVLLAAIWSLRRQATVVSAI